MHPNIGQMIAADGPYAEYADKLMLYGQLVGSWKITSTWYDSSGASHSRQGEWHFAWVLGGRGVQDVLYESGSAPSAYGTTLRCYDPAGDVWHLTWMQPSDREFSHLLGRQDGDRIVQENPGTAPGNKMRWTFSDITPDSFRWRGEASHDNGQTWALKQEMLATRQA